MQFNDRDFADIKTHFQMHFLTKNWKHWRIKKRCIIHYQSWFHSGWYITNHHIALRWQNTLLWGQYWCMRGVAWCLRPCWNSHFAEKSSGLFRGNNPLPRWLLYPLPRLRMRECNRWVWFANLLRDLCYSGIKCDSPLLRLERDKSLFSGSSCRRHYDSLMQFTLWASSTNSSRSGRKSLI